MAVEKADLTPKKLDLKIYAGDGYRFRIRITKDGDPIPLTGVFKAQIRLKRGTTSEPNAEFDIDDSEFTDGKVGLILTSESCRTLTGLKKFKGFWDIQWTPEGADNKTLVQGKLECDPDVTV